ncbi:MAG: carbon storage regulator [bacterium]|nr:carbon storage regulator [bacterium]
MLVVSRKNGQKIMINDNIVVTIVEVKNGQCKIAIEADKDVKIYREEIYYQVKLANLVGKDANTNAVDSVSDLLKNKEFKINDKVEKNANDKDVIVDNNNEKSKSIIIRKDNSKQG